MFHGHGYSIEYGYFKVKGIFISPGELVNQWKINNLGSTYLLHDPLWQDINTNPKGNLEVFVDQNTLRWAAVSFSPGLFLNSASILLFLVLRLISPVCTSEWCFRDTQGQPGAAWSAASETPPSFSVKLIIFLSSHLPPEVMLWLSFWTMTKPQCV